MDGKKKQITKNNGKPYTVSPYDLIWDGDYYYLIGYCDEREAVRTFRVDRIKKQPVVLNKKAVPKSDSYDVSKYTSEIFRMMSTEEATEVTLRCENRTMKSVVDHFSMGVSTKAADKEHFRTKVKVCTSPTFYRWVFGGCGSIVIEGPKEVVTEYKQMLNDALIAQM